MPPLSVEQEAARQEMKSLMIKTAEENPHLGITLEGEWRCRESLAQKLGLQAEWNANSWVQNTVLKLRDEGTARTKAAHTAVLQAVAAAGGSPPSVTSKGFVKGIAKVAAQVGVTSTYLNQVQSLTDARADAYKIVSAKCAEMKLPGLIYKRVTSFNSTKSASSSSNSSSASSSNSSASSSSSSDATEVWICTNLLERAIACGLADKNPYLKKLAAAAESHKDVVIMVNEVRFDKGLSPVTISASGDALNLLECAREVGIPDDSHPYLTTLANAGKVVDDAQDLVEKACEALGIKGPSYSAGKGRALDLLERAIAAEVVNQSPFLIKLVNRQAGCEEAHDIVNKALEARGSARTITYNGGGKAIDLVECAREADVVNRHAYLITLVLIADGVLEAHKMVEKACEAQGLPKLMFNGDGYCTNLMELARAANVVNRHPYLISRAQASDVIRAAHDIVNEACVEQGRPKVKYNGAGVALDLLECAKAVGVVNQHSYLIRLAQDSDVVREVHDIINKACAEQDRPGIKYNTIGRAYNMLDCARAAGIEHPYLNGIARQLAVSRATTEADIERLAKEFEEFGPSTILTDSDLLASIAGVISTRLPDLTAPAGSATSTNTATTTTTSISSCHTIFYAAHDRAEGIDGDEVVAQFTRKHVTEAWDMEGMGPTEAARQFDLYPLILTQNPYEALRAERMAQQLADDRGARFPHHRLYARIGAGGFDPKRYKEGRVYGAFLLVAKGGVRPPGWKLKVLVSGGKEGSESRREEDNTSSPKNKKAKSE